MHLVFKIVVFLLSGFIFSQNTPNTFKNPIVSGFHSDPSICRVGNTYYMTHPTLEWFPALPIMRSKDLVNWEKIGHAIERVDQIHFPDGLDNSLGMFAPSIRYNNGTFYVICTCVGCNGNFIVTATNPEGPWSDPIWIKGPGSIDPTLFWDDDGKSYFLAAGIVNGNRNKWPGINGIFMQEINVKTGGLLGEPIQLTHGHASNAMWTEGPRLFKINGEYLLMVAEGGTNENHAITVFNSKNLWGPYIPNHANPVMTHRHLGYTYPIVKTGHGDLVQTQQGNWWAVLHAKRPIKGQSVLCRETFLAKVEMTNQESGVTPVFNPGIGLLQFEQERPNLPWSPVKKIQERDEFNNEKLGFEWICLRSPIENWYKLEEGKLKLKLRPKVIDSLVNPSFWAQRIRSHHFEISTQLTFNTKKNNEQAGLVVYRKSSTHYQLLKEKSTISLIKTVALKQTGTASTKTVVATVPYSKDDVVLKVKGYNLDLQFYYGENENTLKPIGKVQDFSIVSDEIAGRFNGTVAGLYATSNNIKSSNWAIFNWFQNRNIN
ncbi:glycoside hydrolase family 43 protein [Seonamhaeicola algicola]|uniref:Glycoside hydrolase family 43 protein n=1 Tax=Seonamhaeicola algicola TaxID=1719036 RepID=A0A5C7AUH6_9FLAO|nr:glycoside hydrolase family 43 protein [Seonamhaeicola algicola]TXE11764.1 glycoside hydrolase family 43 protein [Seonamhaeicola algicola]